MVNESMLKIQQTFPLDTHEYILHFLNAQNVLSLFQSMTYIQCTWRLAVSKTVMFDNSCIEKNHQNTKLSTFLVVNKITESLIWNNYLRTNFRFILTIWEEIYYATRVAQFVEHMQCATVSFKKNVKTRTLSLPSKHAACVCHIILYRVFLCTSLISLVYRLSEYIKFDKCL